MIDRDKQPIIGHSGSGFIGFVPKMMNRHGLIAGATGTGKTVTLQSLAETFSEMGTAVFAADMKGDLSGLAKAGGNKESVTKRVESYGLKEHGFAYGGYPVELWDAFGTEGLPLRLTVSSLGPLLLERLLGLNETQGGVLNIAFRIADTEQFPLIDLKDLQALIRFVGDNRSLFTTTYGNISPATIGAIQRALLRLESEGGHDFFGMPDFEVADFFRQVGGKGVINILAADRLSRSPRIYTTFLLWLLSCLFEELPEVGDLPHPKIVFFFDEAHLLFSDMSKELRGKVEQIVRLIRSKGVGVYFVTQAPSDVPESVLGQLGNKVLHALRAYTPKDQRQVRAAAEGFRPNPRFDTAETILALGTGEAVVSLLDATGTPSVTERVAILPPQSYIGPLTPEERSQIVRSSMLYTKYSETVDPESAYEILQRRMSEAAQQEAEQQKHKSSGGEREPSALEDLFGGLFKDVARSTRRQIAYRMGRELTNTLTRGVFGTFFGVKRRK